MSDVEFTPSGEYTVTAPGNELLQQTLHEEAEATVQLLPNLKLHTNKVALVERAIYTAFRLGQQNPTLVLTQPEPKGE